MPPEGASAALELPIAADPPAHGREQTRFLLVFAVLASFMGTSVGMAQVTASLYAVELRSSETMLGLIAGAQSVGVLLVSLPIGMLVDRIGPVRPFLTGTILAGLTYLLIPSYHSAGWLLLCTTLISFFMPLRFVSLNSLFLAQLASLGDSKAGWYRGTHMLGMFLLGPALGAQAVTHLGFTWTYRVIALAFFLTLLLSPIVFARYTPAAERRAGAFWARLRQQLTALVSDRELRGVSLIELGTQASGAFFTFFIVVLAVSHLRLAPSDASTLVGLKGASYIVALFLLGRPLKWLGRRGYGVSFGCIGLGLFSVGLAQGHALLWGGAVLVGLGLGAVQISTLTAYAKIGGRTGHGKISGLSALVGPSGGVFGNLLGGALGRSFGLPSIFLLLSAAFGVAAVLRLWLDGRALGSQSSAPT